MDRVADLHIHTNYSDGILSPSELVAKACEKGLSAISFTDHDTIDSTLEAVHLAKDSSIDFINGIEFSCYYASKEYHILGYHIDIYNDELNEHLVNFRKARYKRALKIHNKLSEMNINFDFDLVLDKAGNAPITRPHFASVMLDIGLIGDFREAFQVYLGDNCPAYEPKIFFSVEECISLVNRTGGLAVLAHPANYIDQPTLYKFIKFGLDGIEVIHPLHNKIMQKAYKKIARQYWLLETGGSDYHGSRDFDDDNFGKYTVPYSVIDSITNLIGRKKI